ncbi:hypothetical protein BS17DRAFT_777405 [Gyrodon lividus]|nr:hypothetical protein BS17DRAFT_777405 [Gyrodon lividus]
MCTARIRSHVAVTPTSPCPTHRSNRPSNFDRHRCDQRSTFDPEHYPPPRHHDPTMLTRLRFPTSDATS